ncbi:hypothetical protein [Methylobacterium sp. WL6]|uniref:hypothetical protein n=1 Tax=Methylobacterium sp. WL6 TaxID=2603901 RepID=UPI0011CB2298|nr:hypothetical protein [Methylobacterium sp. WL6]TXN73426.1 hypothetical protein FV230_01255 [Methylobacterium sp. WL6]
MKNVSIASAIVSAWSVIETVSGKPWTASVESIRMAREAAGHVLDLVKPDDGGKTEIRPIIGSYTLSKLGEVHGDANLSFELGVVAAMAASIAVSKKRGESTDEAVSTLIDAASRASLIDVKALVALATNEAEPESKGFLTDQASPREPSDPNPADIVANRKKKSPKKST